MLVSIHDNQALTYRSVAHHGLTLNSLMFLSKLYVSIHLFITPENYTKMNQHKNHLIKKRTRQQGITSFLCKKTKNCQDIRQMTSINKSTESTTKTSNQLAEAIANLLDSSSTCKPQYLTNDKQSWYIHLKYWYPPPTQQDFHNEWDLHPIERRKIKVYGKTFLEKRWSQSWGVDIPYSGSINQARNVEESSVVPFLLKRVNDVVQKTELSQIDVNEQEKGDVTSVSPYNACLQNWYLTEDTIGLHADDESHNRQEFPIWSLSWGGTRR